MYNSNRLGISHRQVIVRMYLQALRTARDHSYGWAEKRSLQMGIRAQFDQYKNVLDPQRIDFLVTCGQTLLHLNAHHEPYIRTFWCLLAWNLLILCPLAPNAVDSNSADRDPFMCSLDSRRWFR
jgi:hypothetical protein